MNRWSKSLLVLVGVLALSGVQACLTSSASDTGGELNPQPLPPGPDDRKDDNGEATGAAGSSSSSGGPMAPPQDPNDAGSDGGSDAPEGG